MTTPTETVENLEKLKRNYYGFSDKEFQQKHHMGHSIATFQSYCRGIGFFQPNGRNRALADWIKKVLDSKTSARR